MRPTHKPVVLLDPRALVMKIPSRSGRLNRHGSGVPEAVERACKEGPIIATPGTPDVALQTPGRSNDIVLHSWRLLKSYGLASWVSSPWEADRQKIGVDCRLGLVSTARQTRGRGPSALAKIAGLDTPRTAFWDSRRSDNLVLGSMRSIPG